MKDIYPQAFLESSHRLIGIDYDERDCWGIASLFYKHVLNIDLDKYDSEYDDPNDRKLVSSIINREKSNWLKVHKPKFGDIIVLKIYGLSAHVGIYLNEKKFLHTMEKTGSIVDNISVWEKRIEGYYRYGQG